MKNQKYSIFSERMESLKIPGSCWGAVLYSYWQSLNGEDHSFPRLDTDRLIQDIETGRIIRKRNFGKRRFLMLQQWLIEHRK